MRKTLGVPIDEQVEEEEDVPEDSVQEDENEISDKDGEHDEL